MTEPEINLPSKCARLLNYAAMKTFRARILCFAVFLATLAAAQDVIPLYPGTPPGSTPENYPEKKSHSSKEWNTDVVRQRDQADPHGFQACSRVEERDRGRDLPWRRLYGALHHQRGRRSRQIPERERHDRICVEASAWRTPATTPPRNLLRCMRIGKNFETQ